MAGKAGRQPRGSVDCRSILQYNVLTSVSIVVRGSIALAQTHGAALLRWFQC